MLLAFGGFGASFAEHRRLCPQPPQEEGGDEDRDAPISPSKMKRRVVREYSVVEKLCNDLRVLHVATMEWRCVEQRGGGAEPAPSSEAPTVQRGDHPLDLQSVSNIDVPASMGGATVMVAPGSVLSTSLPPSATPITPTPTAAAVAMSHHHNNSDPFVKIVCPPPLAAHTAVMTPDGQTMVLFGGLTTSSDGGLVRNTTSLRASGELYRFCVPAVEWSHLRRDVAEEGSSSSNRHFVPTSSLDRGHHHSRRLAPSPRYGHAACVSAKHRCMYVYGGDAPQYALDDLLWSLSLEEWQWQSISLHPSVNLTSRFFATMEYIDAVEDTEDLFVLVGGSIPAVPKNQKKHVDHKRVKAEFDDSVSAHNVSNEERASTSVREVMIVQRYGTPVGSIAFTLSQ